MFPSPLLAQWVFVGCATIISTLCAFGRRWIDDVQHQFGPTGIFDHLFPTQHNLFLSHDTRTKGSVEMTLASDALELNFDMPETLETVVLLC